jgi:hypothetical protein
VLGGVEDFVDVHEGDFHVGVWYTMTIQGHLQHAQKTTHLVGRSLLPL